MTQTSKKTFMEIIKDNKIEIPIIQRDYAQGRKDVKIEKIRDIFLDAIFQKLKDEKPLYLDFVYGSEEDRRFVPLDGQQRLTTLFLLHWYFGKKENQNIKDLKKFTYATRASSREFCQKLIDTSIDFSKDSLSEQIKDSAWFLTFWEKDPTVQSMLVMIDAIHEKFKGIQESFDNLNKISFEFLKMEHFGLSDDLYIKMNARGKQLTDFENFKAKFQQHIAEKNFEDEGIREIDKFSHKIDTVWLDLFWKYKDENNLVDKQFILFIYSIYFQSYVLYSKDFATPEEVNSNLDKPKNKESFDYLKKCFDLYSDKNQEYDELEVGITLWGKYYAGDSDKTKIFSIVKRFLMPVPTYPEQALFFAQTQYLLKLEEEQKVNKESFQDWMRVVRNLVQNATIDSPQTFRMAGKLIQELVVGCENIYDYLANNVVKSGFASQQVKQEILKAKLIKKYPASKQVIWATEDTNFCMGDIEFALYCIDFNESNIDTFDKDKLAAIQKVIKEHLSESDITNEFRSALFTIRDHKFYTYWRSWLYVAHSHKYCLIYNINDLKDYMNSLGKYVKDLLKQLTNQDIDNLLTNFNPPEDMPSWKRKIIKNPKLLDYSHEHYVAVPENNNCCYLIPRSRVANSAEGKKKLKQIK